MDSWCPKQYQKFSKEREQPFTDLLHLIAKKKDMSVLDLGCGTGILTKRLHLALNAKETLGIDSSSVMLKEAKLIQDTHLNFDLQDINTFKSPHSFDLIFSHAALQWVQDHPSLFKRYSHYLTDRGQIAIQMPANFDYPSHTIAEEVATEKPFRERLRGHQQPSVLKVEEYAELLYRLGFKKQMVRLQVYPHVLDSVASLLEWVKGSLLTFYKSRLSSKEYEIFLAKYYQRLKEQFGETGPIFLPFKRILLWGEKE